MAQKLQLLPKCLYTLFGSAPYTGRSSSIKPSCSKTELLVAPQRKSVETKTKMLEHAQSSPAAQLAHEWSGMNVLKSMLQ